MPKKAPHVIKKLNAWFWIMFNFWWSAEWSEWWKLTEMWKKAPVSSKNKMLIFILRSTSDDRPSNPSDKLIKMRNNEMLFQLGSSVVSVWVFCCSSLGLLYAPPPPNSKVGIRVAKKFRFFQIYFQQVPTQGQSVQSLLHFLAMQFIYDEQCTNWLTLHFYNL